MTVLGERTSEPAWARVRDRGFTKGDDETEKKPLSLLGTSSGFDEVQTGRLGSMDLSPSDGVPTSAGDCWLDRNR